MKRETAQQEALRTVMALIGEMDAGTIQTLAAWITEDQTRMAIDIAEKLSGLGHKVCTDKRVTTLSAEAAEMFRVENDTLRAEVERLTETLRLKTISNDYHQGLVQGLKAERDEARGALYVHHAWAVAEKIHELTTFHERMAIACYSEQLTERALGLADGPMEPSRYGIRLDGEFAEHTADETQEIVDRVLNSATPAPEANTTPKSGEGE